MSEYSYQYGEGAPFTEEYFMGALAAFQAADPITQIIVITFLTLITVGAIIFSLYMIKMMIEFVIKMIKGIVKTASAKPRPSQSSTMNQNQPGRSPIVGPTPIVNSGVIQYPQAQDITPNQVQPPIVQQPIVQPPIVQQPIVQPPEQTQAEFFCSNCGARFSNRMLTMIKTNLKAYCEQCGQGFMVAEN